MPTSNSYANPYSIFPYLDETERRIALEENARQQKFNNMLTGISTWSQLINPQSGKDWLGVVLGTLVGGTLGNAMDKNGGNLADAFKSVTDRWFGRKSRKPTESQYQFVNPITQLRQQYQATPTPLTMQTSTPEAVATAKTTSAAPQAQSILGNNFDLGYSPPPTIPNYNIQQAINDYVSNKFTPNYNPSNINKYPDETSSNQADRNLAIMAAQQKKY